MVPPLDKIGGDRSAAGNTTVLPPFPTRSGIWGATENIYSLYSLRVLPPLTQSRNRHRADQIAAPYPLGHISNSPRPSPSGCGKEHHGGNSRPFSALPVADQEQKNRLSAGSPG